MTKARILRCIVKVLPKGNACIVLFLAVLFLSISCANTEEPTAQGIRNVNSQLCGNRSGVEGWYWDISNGVHPGDIPGGVPTVARLDGNFIHSGQPLLGFNIPSGYSPVDLRQDNPLLIGVNLRRNADRAVWRYYLQTVNSAINATQVSISQPKNSKKKSWIRICPYPGNCSLPTAEVAPTATGMGFPISWTALRMILKGSSSVTKISYISRNPNTKIHFRGTNQGFL